MSQTHIQPSDTPPTGQAANQNCDHLATPSAIVAWSSDELAEATSGQWLFLEHGLSACRIVTDNRLVQAGDIFLALKGERFDAHDFVASALANGAVAAIVSHGIEGVTAPQLVVADTRLALGHLGAYRRQQYPHLKVVALTGSSGKTTTKEMLGSILRQIAPTLVTRGNLNNDLGVPMMLLELEPSHHYAVMELGASHVGEIDYTSHMVQPHVAGVLNIGTAHMGEFGGREGIARAKSEIFNHLFADGVAVVPVNDDFAGLIQQATGQHKMIRFGSSTDEHGDVYAENIQLDAAASSFDLVTPQGRITIQLPFAGQHNVDNALAAGSFALAFGIPLELIASGLSQAVGAKGRLSFKQYGRYLIIDDTYNANPHSMRAAAKVLEAQQGSKVLVLGDIGELGDAAQQEHYSLGEDIASLSLDAIFTVGEFAAHTLAGINAQPQKPASLHAAAFEDKASLFNALYDYLQVSQYAAFSLLFKGSRYTKMESLIADLVEKA